MEKLTFKQFTKEYHIRFFEKRNFAEYIDSLGLGCYDIVLWDLRRWEDEYSKFRLNLRKKYARKK